jgi:hypothetical protein
MEMLPVTRLSFSAQAPIRITEFDARRKKNSQGAPLSGRSAARNDTLLLICVT